MFNHSLIQWQKSKTDKIMIWNTFHIHEILIVNVL